MVEVQTCLIGLFFNAFGVNAAPADGHPEHRVAHLGQQGDVLLIAVIKIHRLLVGVIIALCHHRLCSCRAGHHTRQSFDAAVRHLIGFHTGCRCRACCDHVGQGWAAAAGIPAALVLVGGGRSSPEKSFRECTHGRLPPYFKTVSSGSPAFTVWPAISTTSAYWSASVTSTGVSRE